MSRFLNIVNIEVYIANRAVICYLTDLQ